MAAKVTPGQLGIATPFGELLGNSTAEMERELQDYVEMGVDWVRLDIHWSLVQPNANGGFDWTLVDRVFNAIEAKGIKITAVLNNTPNWVDDNLSSWSDQQAFGRFAGEAAARYDNVVDHWEILNEQNKAGISPQDYTQVLKQAYNAIKAVDSDDVVITGGTAAVPSTGNGMWGAVDYLEEMYEAGAKGYFDAVGYHPYSFPLMPSNSAAWNGWQIMEDGIRQAMLDNGDGNKQIWMTEFGAKTIGGGVTVSQSEAAAMLREAVDLAQDHDWAGPIMWFSYQDSSFEPGFGLRDGNGNQRDAYWAFKELANLDNKGTSTGSGSGTGTGSGSSNGTGTGTSGNPVTGKTIHDTSGNDVLQGTSSNDVIHSSGGQDTLRGGGGEDTFVFAKAGLWDNIGDWAADDTIDLSAIDANTGRSGHQDFKLIGSKWLSGAGDLGVYADRGHNKTYVQADLDGDKDFEISIVLNGVHQLDASNFVF
ncbi:glycosyl hydrolase [Paracoccus sp. (in: a-proteobacteria)]|uniref:glycosyl hydrolase n=1 Tax=Paracoccus sp. TaxID=267 RepID=UPI0035AF7B32